MFQYTIEKDHLIDKQDISKIIKKDSKPKKWEQQISDPILIKKLQPTFNTLEKFVLLKRHYVRWCPYSELFWSIFSAFRLNTERYSVSLRILFEYGEMLSRITPNTGTFYAERFSQRNLILPWKCWTDSCLTTFFCYSDKLEPWVLLPCRLYIFVTLEDGYCTKSIYM